MRALALIGTVLLTLLGSSPVLAAAPARDASYSFWTVDGSTVHLRFMLPTGEAASLAAPGAPPPGIAAVSTAVGEALAVTSGGDDCPAIDQGEGVGQVYTLALTPGMDRFEIVFACPQASGIVLHDRLLFDRVPGHVNYARVQVDGGPARLQLFTRAQQSFALPQTGQKLSDVGLQAFARMAAQALFDHPQRIALIAGLLLLTRRRSDLGLIAGALGLGYLAAIAAAFGGFEVSDPVFALAVGGLLVALLGATAVRLRGAGGGKTDLMAGAGLIAVAAVALVVALIAALALHSLPIGLATAGFALFALAQVQIAGAEARFRWLAFAPASLFALLDGLAPAGELAVLQLPAARIAPFLAAYGLAAVLTATAMASAVMVAVWLGRRWLKPAGELGIEVGGAVLIGLGLFGFVSGIFS